MDIACLRHSFSQGKHGEAYQTLIFIMLTLWKEHQNHGLNKIEMMQNMFST